MPVPYGTLAGMNNSCGAECALPNSLPGSYKEICVSNNGQATPSNNGSPTAATAQAPTSQAELDRLAAEQKAKTTELSRLIAQISEAIQKSKAVAGIAPAKEVDLDRDEVGQRQATEGQSLKVTRLKSGDLAHSLNVVDLAFGNHAFVERGTRTKNPFIEITGNSDKQIAAAARYAAVRWAGDPVVIHAEGKDERRVIEQAVRAGLNVVNQEPRIQQMVADETARQALSQPGFKHEARTPVIERIGR
jgi:hypothetical protein